MDALQLTINALGKAEMGYHGKFINTIGQIQHISIMRGMDICYTDCHLVIQTGVPTIPVFQCLNCCIQYLYIHPHKPIFYPSNSYDGSNVIRLACSGN